MAKALIAVLVLFFLINDGQANMQCMKHTITSTGVGRRSYKTLIAVIKLGIHKTGETAGGVQRQIAQASNELVSYIRSKKVSKLHTTSVSLYPTYDYRSSNRRITGYRGSFYLSFEVPIKDSGSILDGSVRNGATVVSSIRFRAENSVSSNARRLAIRDAVVNARNEAYVASYNLGRNFGAAISIKITDSFFPNPVAATALQRAYSMPAPGARVAPPPPTSIIAQEQTVQAYVTVTFSII